MDNSKMKLAGEIDFLEYMKGVTESKIDLEDQPISNAQKSGNYLFYVSQNKDKNYLFNKLNVVDKEVEQVMPLDFFNSSFILMSEEEIVILKNSTGNFFHLNFKDESIHPGGKVDLPLELIKINKTHFAIIHMKGVSLYQIGKDGVLNIKNVSSELSSNFSVLRTEQSIFITGIIMDSGSRNLIALDAQSLDDLWRVDFLATIHIGALQVGNDLLVAQFWPEENETEIQKINSANGKLINRKRFKGRLLDFKPHGDYIVVQFPERIEVLDAAMQLKLEMVNDQYYVFGNTQHTFLLNSSNKEFDTLQVFDEKLRKRNFKISKGIEFVNQHDFIFENELYLLNQ